MLKGKKLIKALQAEGWSVRAERGDFLQLVHRDHTGLLTLPDYKFTLPRAVAEDLGKLTATKGRAA